MTDGSPGGRDGLAPWIVGARASILASWLAVVLLLGPFAPKASERLTVGVRMEGSQAASVETDLAARFGSTFVHRVAAVVKDLPSPESRDGYEALVQIVGSLRKAPGVTGIVSYLDSDDPIFLGRGGYFLLAGLDPGEHFVDSLIPGLRAAGSAAVASLRTQYPRAELIWTGEAPLNYDLRRVSALHARNAELRVLPVALFLLLFAFGSAIAAILPLALGVLAVLLTLGASALLARYWDLSILIENIASMIGLGLGIDYALLFVSRFREALASGQDRKVATEEAIRRAGRTLLLSALPVVIGFGALTTVPISELRSIGVAGMLVTFFTLLLSVTLLPACLSWIGARVDAGRLFRRTTGQPTDAVKWRQWGRYVASRPGAALALAGVPMLLLAGNALRLETGALLGDWLPPEPESVRALHRMEEMGKGQVIQSLRIILDLPPGSSASSEEGWEAIMRFSLYLEEHPGVERVHSLRTVLGDRARPEALSRLSPTLRSSLVSIDERSALFEALPAIRRSRNRPAGDPVLLRSDAEDLARDLRRGDAAALLGRPGARIRVGGLPAANAEFEDRIERRFRAVFLLVTGATLLALLLGFRSVLVALKAVALNLLTVGAAFGALVLVFQDGYGSALLGVEGPTGRVFTIVPILVFSIVFGLSMDYEVILVSRVAEASRNGMDEISAIAEGVARTGRVITTAAAIMVAVFASFILGAFLPIQMLGFALTVAVLLDATIVRMVIGPALLSLAGRWNWWPGTFGGLKRRSLPFR